MEHALEGLCLFSFPMEVHADGDVLQRERRIARQGHHLQLAIETAVPADASFKEEHLLLALYHFALGGVGTVQREAYALGTDDAHLHGRLLREERLCRCTGPFRRLRQTGHHTLHFFLFQTHLFQDADDGFCLELSEIGFLRSDHQSGHIERARTDHADGIAGRTVLLAKEYHEHRFFGGLPPHDIHHGLRCGSRQRLVDASEKACETTLRSAAHHQGGCRPLVE